MAMTRRKFTSEDERVLARKERQKGYEESRKGGSRLPTSRLNTEESDNLDELYKLITAEVGKCKIVMMCIDFSLANEELFRAHLETKYPLN